VWGASAEWAALGESAAPAVLAALGESAVPGNPAASAELVAWVELAALVVSAVPANQEPVALKARQPGSTTLRIAAAPRTATERPRISSVDQRGATQA
jgi:hypothetical protein